jgi:hypothetical protein
MIIWAAFAIVKFLQNSVKIMRSSNTSSRRFHYLFIVLKVSIDKLYIIIKTKMRLIFHSYPVLEIYKHTKNSHLPLHSKYNDNYKDTEARIWHRLSGVSQFYYPLLSSYRIPLSLSWTDSCSLRE